MYESLALHLNKHVVLSEEELETVEKQFKPRSYRKRQYILQEGEISRYETFIVRGMTRTYEVDDQGQEHILQFGIEGHWIGDIVSFSQGTPSGYNIDCLEDCEVLQITKESKELLLQVVPKLERHFRILIQNAYTLSLKRITATLSKPAPQRYYEFVHNFPHIERRVPNHQIASYLGLTPQSLSRIRKQAAAS